MEVMGVFAEFERNIIRERIKPGLQRAWDAGDAARAVKVADQVHRCTSLTRCRTGILKTACTLGTKTVQLIKGGMAATLGYSARTTPKPHH